MAAALGLVVVAGLAAVVAVFLVHRGGTANTLSASAQNTLNSGGFDFELTVSQSSPYGNSGATVVGNAEFDPDRELITVDVTVDVDDDDSDGRTVVYDGWIYSFDNNDFPAPRKFFYADDISDDIDDLFRIYREAIALTEDPSAADLESAMDRLEGSLGTYLEDGGISYGAVQESLDAMLPKLSDEDYLRENFGYETTPVDGGTRYSLTVTVKALAALLAETLTEAIPELGALDLDDPLLEQIIGSPVLNLSYTISGGYLSEAAISITGYYTGDVSLAITFSNFGHPSLDKAELEATLAQYR
jgi:hypothetical protein